MRSLPYPRYKPGPAKWVGDVPDHWTIERIKYSLAEKRPRTAPDLSPGAISYGRVIAKDGERLPEETLATYQEVLAGEYLINPINLNYDLISLRTALSGMNVVVSPAYIVAKPNTAKLLPSFGSYLLYVFDIRHMKSLGAGVRQTIGFKDIGNCYWALPPLSEQEAIAAFLDRETGRIDRLIDKKNLFLDLIRERIAALVHEAISDPTLAWVRFGHVATRINRPAALSESSSMVRLGLFNRGRGIFHKPAADEEGMGDSSFYFVEEGDLIISGQFAWEGAVAMATVNENGCVVSHRYPIYRGANGVATEYLLAFLRSDLGAFVLNDTSRGSAGRNRPLNTSKLEKEKLPIPSGEFQQRIAIAIAFERQMKRLVDSSIELLKEHRSALITAAVTGKIDVRGLAAKNMKTAA